MNDFVQQILNDPNVQRKLRTEEKFSIGFGVPIDLWLGSLIPPVIGFKFMPAHKGSQLKGAIEVNLQTHLVHVQVGDDQTVSLMFIKK